MNHYELGSFKKMVIFAAVFILLIKSRMGNVEQIKTKK